jgi:putative endonuclease
MHNMYYVYVLLSKKTYRLYTGSTDNLKRRFQEHQDGIGGEYTKKNRPFTILFYEAFLDKKDATKQEIFFINQAMVERY